MPPDGFNNVCNYSLDNHHLKNSIQYSVSINSPIANVKINR